MGPDGVGPWREGALGGAGLLEELGVEGQGGLVPFGADLFPSFAVGVLESLELLAGGGFEGLALSLEFLVQPGELVGEVGFQLLDSKSVEALVGLVSAACLVFDAFDGLVLEVTGFFAELAPAGVEGFDRAVVEGLNGGGAGLVFGFGVLGGGLDPCGAFGELAAQGEGHGPGQAPAHGMEQGPEEQGGGPEAPACGAQRAGVDPEEAEEDQGGERGREDDAQPPWAVSQEQGQEESAAFLEGFVEFPQAGVEFGVEGVEGGCGPGLSGGGGFGAEADEGGPGGEEQAGVLEGLVVEVAGLGEPGLEGFVVGLGGLEIGVALAVGLELGALDFEGGAGGPGLDACEGVLTLVFGGALDALLAVVEGAVEEGATFAGMGFEPGAAGVVLFAGDAEGFFVLVADAVGACGEVFFEVAGAGGEVAGQRPELFQSGEGVGDGGEGVIHSRDGVVGGVVRGRRGPRRFG